MKKWMAAVLAAAMMASMCGCGGTAGDASQTGSAGSAAGESAEVSVVSSASDAEKSTAAETAEDVQLDGSYIELTTGVGLTLDAGYFEEMDIDFFSRTNYAKCGGEYSVDGNTVRIPWEDFPDQEFQAEKAEEGYHLVSEHYTFVPEEEFYRFENVQVCQQGDTVEAGDVSYTLESVSFENSVRASDVNQDPRVDSLDAPDGMVYVRMKFNLVNNSKNALEPEEVLSPVIAYDDGFVYKSYELKYNYLILDQDTYRITNGGGSNANGQMTIPALNSHEVIAYVQVASAVAENPDAPLYLALRLPDGDSSKLAVYDLRSGGENINSELYGTWALTEIHSDAGSLVVSELEADGNYICSDRGVIIAAAGKLYAFDASISSEFDAEFDGDTVTGGKNVWTLEDGKLVRENGSSEIYYEKVSDSQEFPSPTKNEIAEMLEGTWRTASGKWVTFSDQTLYTDNYTATQKTNDNYEYALQSGYTIDTGRNLIYFRVEYTSENQMFTLALDYSYDNGVLSLSLDGEPMTKQ